MANESKKEGAVMRIPDMLRRPLLDAARRVYCRRPADFVIAPHGEAYLRRWYVIPRNRWFNIYLHQFLLSDDDRALHDHPWRNVSILLSGSYREWRFAVPELHEAGGLTFSDYEAGDVLARQATDAHRIELTGVGSVWTLFVTGPVVREWGFQLGDEWVRHDAYADVVGGVSSIKSAALQVEARAKAIEERFFIENTRPHWTPPPPAVGDDCRRCDPDDNDRSCKRWEAGCTYPGCKRAKS
jgi:hypothetical protein